MSSWCPSAACSNNSSYSAPRRPARPFLGGLLAICALGVLPPLALAQDGAFVARLDIEQRFEYSDNPDLATTKDRTALARTDLGFSLQRRTAIDTFLFDIGGQIEFGDDDPGESTIENPFFSLAFDRDVGRATFDLNLRFRETDVSSLVTETDEILGVDFATLDTGKREDSNFSIGAEIGIDAPVGASLRVARDRLRYSGTTDPTLRDQDTDTLEGTIFFRFDPRITGRLFTTLADLDVDGVGGVDRETTIFGSGVEIDLSPVLTLDLGISQDKIELNGTTNRVEEGLSVTADLSREMANGTLGLALASEVGENGRRDSVSVSRSMELPRGALSYRLGLTQTNGLGTNPLYGIDWSQELPRGSFVVSLTQSVTTDSSANEQISSSLSVAYTQELTELSSFSARAALRRSDELRAGGIDSERIDLSLTYRRELERDWGLVSGFSHIRATQDSTADRSSNTVFIGLEKSLTWN